MLTDILKKWGYEIHIDEEAGNLSGRDKQVPDVKDRRFTQTSFGTVVHDRSGKWLGQYETEDAAVEMIREMAQDIGEERTDYDSKILLPYIQAHVRIKIL